MSRGVRVAAWGGALPPAVVTNAELEARLDTDDAWIVERTGIRRRHRGGTTGELAHAAGAAALARAGCDPASVDLLVLATTTPERTMPATASGVHAGLGLSGAAYDLNGACAGFVLALSAAHGAVAAGTVSRALVIGADTMTTIVDPGDRTTAVLFGDGAGAAVLEPTDGEDCFLSWDFGTDGTAADLLVAELGRPLAMEGREVYRRAVRCTVESAAAAMQRAKCRPEEIALFVPHQANLRIIEAAAERLGIARDRTATMVERTGNTSAASIPLVLAETEAAGRLAPGDLVLVSGFGAGMTWASAVLRWDG